MKNKILFLFAFVALIGLASCNNAKSVQPGDAHFKFTIQGMPNMRLVFIPTNPFDSIRDTVMTDANGTAIFTKHLDKGTYFEVSLGEQVRFPLFLLPGDTTFMDATVQDFFGTQQFSGQTSLYNNYLADYTKSSNKFQKAIYQIFSRPEDVAVKAIDSVRNEHKKVLDDFLKTNSDADAEFVRIEKARILYEWALLRNVYPLYFRYLNKIDSFEMSPEYMSYLGAVDVNDSALLDLPIYQSYLDSYLGSKVEPYYKSDALQAEYKSPIVYRLKMIDELFDNKAIKQVLAFKSVMNFIRYDGIKDYDLYFDKFKEICTYPYYQRIVDEMLAEWQHLKKGMPSYNFTFVDMDGNQVSMSDFKGKYVYVDVWATWCNPCRKEIPYLKKMEEEFHGKNIVFVSISVDQTQDPWRAMVQEDSLKGVQLWAGQAREFSKFYKISGIPRFMLFDKEGNIIEASATRPSGGVDKQIAALPGL